jgi:hypothetical protein
MQRVLVLFVHGGGSRGGGGGGEAGPTTIASQCETRRSWSCSCLGWALWRHWRANFGSHNLTARPALAGCVRWHGCSEMAALDCPVSDSEHYAWCLPQLPVEIPFDARSCTTDLLDCFRCRFLPCRGCAARVVSRADQQKTGRSRGRSAQVTPSRRRLGHGRQASP